MKPQIKIGHKFLCKKSVIMKDSKTEAYTKGHTYSCQIASFYPGDKHSCGYITDNQGNKVHAWPYDPQNHLWCNDSWTEFFTGITKYLPSKKLTKQNQL